MMELAMGVFPCPKCGREAKAEVRTTFFQGEFVDFVSLRYRVKKHSGCCFECYLGREIGYDKSYLEDGDMMRKLDIIMDEFQDMIKKGEIAWSE